MTIAPCRGCSKRKVGCHATCEEYIKYRTNLDEINEKVRKQKELEHLGLMPKRRR